MEKSSELAQTQAQSVNNSLNEPLNLQKEVVPDFQSNQAMGQYTQHSFYLFINPMSGNKEGQFMLDLKPNYVQLEIPNKKLDKRQLNFFDHIKSYDVRFHFINLANQEQQLDGINHLKQTLQEKERHVSAITCGGDGTVMWVAEALDKNDVNLDDVPIGIIALGTGNDFSRALGWGACQDIPKLLKKNFKELKNLALNWIQGQVTDFDIWDIEFSTFDNGHFTVIKKNGDSYEEKALQDPSGKTLQLLKKTFCNYFSAGVDARIGIEFDKKRTKSRIGNLCVYLCSSISRFFKRKPKMGHEISALEQLKQPQQQNQSTQQQEEETKRPLSQDLDKVKFEQSNSSQNQNTHETYESEPIFRTRTAQSIMRDKNTLEQLKKDNLEEYNQTVNKGDRFLKGSPTCILMLNIDSYAGGTNGIWKGAKKKALVDIQNKKPLQQTQEFVKQQFSDGKLEILSFDQLIDIGLERVFSGMSNRVAQGQGPFKFSFREKDKNGILIKTYFQIDGEYFIVTAPKNILVKKSLKVPHGKIRVIVHQKMYQKIENEKE